MSQGFLIEPDGCTGHADLVHTVAWSPSGDQLLSADKYGLKIWDVGNLSQPLYSSPICIGDISAGCPRNGITSVAWSPSGEMIVAGHERWGDPYNSGSGANFTLWNSSDLSHPLDSVDVLADLSTTDDLGVDAEGIKSVAWSPTSDRVVLGIGEYLMMWNVSDLSCPMSAAYLEGTVDSVAWSSDGLFIASASTWGESGGGKGQIKVFDSEHMRDSPLNTVDRTGQKQMYSIAFSPDGNSILSGDKAGAVLVWQAVFLKTLTLSNVTISSCRARPGPRAGYVASPGGSSSGGSYSGGSSSGAYFNNQNQGYDTSNSVPQNV